MSRCTISYDEAVAVSGVYSCSPLCGKSDKWTTEAWINMAAAGGKYWLMLNATTLFGEVRSLCVLCNWPGKVLWWSCEINFNEVINTRFLLPLLLSALHFFQRCNGLEIFGFNRSAGEVCSHAKSYFDSNLDDAQKAALEHFRSCEMKSFAMAATTETECTSGLFHMLYHLFHFHQQFY